MRKYLTLLFFLCLSAIAADAAAPEAREALERGRALFERGRWIDARLAFTEARAAAASDDRATGEQVDYYLAAISVELGSEDAEGALTAFMERYPGSTYANDVRFALGSFYCAAGDMPRAREVFAATDRKALAALAREQYDVRMGYAAFAEGDYTAASAAFDRIGPRSRYADHALYYRSYIDYAEGKYGRAKQGFRRLVASDSYGDLAPFYLLQIEFLEGNYRYVTQEGGALARRAVPARRAEIERVVAESWFRLGDYARTVEHLEAAAAAGAEPDRSTCYLMGYSLYRTARYDDAAEWLRKACGPEDALTQNASYHLADCCLRAGDKAGALQAFALATDGRFDASIAEDALFNYAKLQYELGDGAFNGAINLLTRYVERYPSSPRADEARTLLVAAYYNSRDYEAAYRAVKNSPVMDGDLSAALQKIAYFRGLEALRAGDRAAAERLLAESAQVGGSPKYAALAAFWQGEIAFDRQDYTVAAARYDAYLKRAPATEREYAMACYNLGYCAFMRDDMSRAESSFRRFLRHYSAADRYRADALNRLGDAAYAGRRFEEAAARYAEAAAVHTPERHYAAYKRAVTLGILGQAERKREALRAIVDAREGDYVDDASYELGRSYIAAGIYADGARQLERFVETYPASPHRAQALTDLGLAYINLGDRDRSLRAYGLAVEAAPQSDEARQAMQGIRDIYVSEDNVEGYFAYVEQAGLQSDLTAIARDSLSFAAARKLYLANRAADAEKSLRSYIRSYPDGNYMVDALYFLSDCYLRGGKHDEAIGTLSALADRGTTPYSVAVLDKLSELTAAAGRHDEAAAAFRKLYDAAPTTTVRENAMTGYVRSTVAAGDPDRIAAMAADVRTHADAGVTARREATFALAEQLHAAGSPEADALWEELASEVRSREGSAAAFRRIEKLFAEGDMEAVEQAVFAYAERDPHAFYLAKAYLLLGDAYLARGDAFQARATYQSVADGYSPADDGIVAEARERIAKLKEA